MPNIAAPPPRWDAETEVLVIGGGACGLTAGLRALAAGAEVLVLERDARPTGSTALSSGFVPAPGTRFQRAIGVEDTPERFAADIQAKAGGAADPVIVAAATRAIGPSLEWLADSHGLDWIVPRRLSLSRPFAVSDAQCAGKDRCSPDAAVVARCGGRRPDDCDERTSGNTPSCRQWNCPALLLNARMER